MKLCDPSYSTIPFYHNGFLCSVPTAVISYRHACDVAMVRRCAVKCQASKPRGHFADNGKTKLDVIISRWHGE